MAIGALLPPAGGAAVRVAGAWVSEGARWPSDQLSSAPGAAMLPTKVAGCGGCWGEWVKLWGGPWPVMTVAIGAAVPVLTCGPEV